MSNKKIELQLNNIARRSRKQNSRLVVESSNKYNFGNKHFGYMREWWNALLSPLKIGDKGGCYSAYNTPPTPLDRGESSSHCFCDNQTLFVHEKKFNIHQERGFTLIEVLISIFVLSIGIFGVMALFPVRIPLGPFLRKHPLRMHCTNIRQEIQAAQITTSVTL